jgi:phospho-N-acetylmuramoyl-pentapeptide-transferase
VETLSVIAQVGWFKLTRRRLLACSPLHNHFLFRGDHEMKIVVRFWICSAVSAILGLSLLKIR